MSQMTDKELLEYAAKAAGYVIYSWDDATNCPYIIDPSKPSFRPYCWMPRIDDGDALRLAVKLRMTIRIFDMLSDAKVLGDNETMSVYPILDKLDNMAATRLAIVRAAAEIGKGMP